MNRRDLITFLGGAAAAWPLAARAHQTERIRQVGVLISVADDAQGQARLAAFHKGMQELGRTEGRNIQFETRFSGGDGGRARAYSRAGRKGTRLTPQVREAQIARSE
jgi:putative tryptophan/tyrosine transport system substrate-binding protein